MPNRQRASLPSRSVFLNCPFDEDYKAIFMAIVFAVIDSGFVCKCALEENDSSRVRIEKIANLIARSKFGIHDLCRAGADVPSGLARMNMPFELGLFLGAKIYGDRTQSKKACLIMEAERYSYQKCLSDIAGQDTHAHKDDPLRAIRVVVAWLRSASRRRDVPGEERTVRRYNDFIQKLPDLANRLDLDPDALSFMDYRTIVEDWLRSMGAAGNTARDKT